MSTPQNVLPQPDPQAILGLNSVFVYGANAQIATPLNLQVALGSNLQLCVNPGSLSSLFPTAASLQAPSGIADLLGSGFGGNMQCTLGTNANLVIGQTFDINVGPRRIQVDCHTAGDESPQPIHTITIVLADTIHLLTLALPFIYALAQDDTARRILLVVYQVTLQILLVSILNFHDLYRGQRTEENGVSHDVYDTTFSAPYAETLDGKYHGLAATAECLAVLGVLGGELLLEGAGAVSSSGSNS
jgi:hypothetical protein